MNRTSLDFGGVLLAAMTAFSACTERAGNDGGGGPDLANNDAGSGASPSSGGSSSSGSSSSGSNTGGVSANAAGASNLASGGTAGLGAAGKPGADLSPPDPSCDLPGVAFCDAFTKASPGGRAGALDDAHW